MPNPILIGSRSAASVPAAATQRPRCEANAQPPQAGFATRSSDPPLIFVAGILRSDIGSHIARSWIALTRKRRRRHYSFASRGRSPGAGCRWCPRRSGRRGRRGRSARPGNRRDSHSRHGSGSRRSRPARPFPRRTVWPSPPPAGRARRRRALRRRRGSARAPRRAGSPCRRGGRRPPDAR